MSCATAVSFKPSSPAMYHVLVPSTSICQAIIGGTDASSSVKSRITRINKINKTSDEKMRSGVVPAVALWFYDVYSSLPACRHLHSHPGWDCPSPGERSWLHFETAFLYHFLSSFLFSAVTHDSDLPHFDWALLKYTILQQDLRHEQISLLRLQTWQLSFWEPIFYGFRRLHGRLCQNFSQLLQEAPNMLYTDTYCIQNSSKTASVLSLNFIVRTRFFLSDASTDGSTRFEGSSFQQRLWIREGIAFWACRLNFYYESTSQIQCAAIETRRNCWFWVKACGSGHWCF